MATFILEAGMEELPARFQPGLEAELLERFTKALNEAELVHQSLSVCSTPRRFAVTITGLNLVQPTRTEQVTGPPVRVAYDANGQYTPAAQGFARTNGVDVSALQTVTTDKGDYLAVSVTRGGASTAAVLAVLCQGIVSTLPFPKSMRWGSDDFTFARPLRWLVALLDDQLIPFTVGRVPSGRETHGHRVHAPGPFSINHAADYAAVMATASVVPHALDRRNAIVRGGDEQAAKVHGKVLWKQSLLDEVQGLCEHPVPLLGDIDPAYLEVPREVLLTSMESHQKSFGIEGADGKLLPHFLTVLNITPPDVALVKTGWERVLRARLEDARFFWRTDLASSFDQWLDALDKVIFLAPLGSMGDKTRRLSSLCAYLAQRLRTRDGAPWAESSLIPLAERAGRLSKADLVSQMVGEFDTVQGIMGGIYARKKGEAEEVAAALAEQYLPAGPDSPVPATRLGAILSMADKADTMVGCFGLGMIPTGAADPYALRRAALGIARILLENNLTLEGGVVGLFTRARVLYADRPWKLDAAETLSKLEDFFAGRVKNLFLTTGHDTLFVEAAAAGGSGAADVVALILRLTALEDLSRTPDFIPVVQTFKRVANIIRKQAKAETLSGQVNASLLTDDAEKALAAHLAEHFSDVTSLIERNNYTEVLSRLSALRPLVDAFFEKVMVMCDDPALRTNRLNMLMVISKAMDSVADFSALQI